jgi:uncharacterized protein (TIGR01777 family)
MKVAITGATGLIGTALQSHLRAAGHEVVRIVRHDAAPGDIVWSPAEHRIPDGALDGVDAVVNLAGAGIADHRWTDEYKRTLLESRTSSTTLIAEAIARSDGGPRTLLSGSAVGYYGARGDEELDESSRPGDDFLAGVVVEWERSTAAAEEAGVRVAHLRTGVVLDADGGALAKQLPLFKFGLGGKMGSGRQWLSWITLADHVAATTHLLTSDVSGPVNLTAPAPATNAEFTDALGDVLHRPTFMPIPSFGPKLLLGSELAESLLFTGQKVLPRVLVDDGFTFAHTEIRTALAAVLAR